MRNESSPTKDRMALTRCGRPARGSCPPPTPSSRDSRSLVLGVTVGRRSRIPRLAHDLAYGCRHASVPIAVNIMIRNHNQRATFGDSRLPVLVEKQLACRDYFTTAWFLEASRSGL